MSDRSLKKSVSGKSNRPVVGDVDENLDLFSVNRVNSLDGTRRSYEQSNVAKSESDDDKKHANDTLYTIPEVPLGTLSRLLLEAKNVTSKLHSISTTRAGSKNESDQPSKPTRSNSNIRASNIPTIRSSNIGPTFPTVRSTSAPRKTTTASVSSPKRTVSRSLTPVSRKPPSRSSTPSRISTTTSTTPSFKKASDSQRSRSLTPRSKPQIAATSAIPSIKTKVRSASVSSRPSLGTATSVSATPRTPPRLKDSTTLAFGRPVGTTKGTVNSPKRNTSPDVTRTRPKVHSVSSSLIPTFSSVSHAAATPKTVKPYATATESTRTGRKLSKASVQMAINQLVTFSFEWLIMFLMMVCLVILVVLQFQDVTRNGKANTNQFSSTMLYPHSIRTSSLRKQSGSEGSSSCSNQEEEEGKSLTKEEISTEKNDSARYDALLDVKDVKDTNWLLNIDDESNHSLIFDNAFDSPPELFSPL